jgi:hypothetical protein
VRFVPEAAPPADVARALSACLPEARDTTRGLRVPTWDEVGDATLDVYTRVVRRTGRTGRDRETPAGTATGTAA